MDNHITALKTIYKSTSGDLTDLQFHQKIHDYIAYIVSTPELSSALLDESRKLINENKKVKKDPVLSQQSKDELITRNERKSVYKDYMSLYLTMYIPLEDFNNGVYVEPSTLFYLKGKEYMTEKEKSLMGGSFMNHRLSYGEHFKKIHERLITLFLETCNKKQILPNTPKGVSFDPESSVLTVSGKAIEIKLKNDNPNSYYVLELMFKDEKKLEDRFYYSEMKDELLDTPLGDKDWRAIYRACKDIQEKVRKATKIEDFLIIKTGESGYIQVNSDYL